MSSYKTNVRRTAEYNTELLVSFTFKTSPKSVKNIKMKSPNVAFSFLKTENIRNILLNDKSLPPAYEHTVDLLAVAILCRHCCWWWGGCVHSCHLLLAASPSPAPPCSVGRRHDRKSAWSSPPPAGVRWGANTSKPAANQPHSTVKFTEYSLKISACSWCLDILTLKTFDHFHATNK